MTCIAAIAEKGVVYMGGDSAGVAGLSITIRADEKVFINNGFIFGFTSSFRMGQLLQYKFDPPKQKASQSDMAYMVTDFIDAVRKCFADNGFDKNGNLGGTFLVGYNGRLYRIDSDYQVGIPSSGYDSVGCGHDLAKGSLFSTKGKPEDRIKTSLEAAAKFSGGVEAPFKIIKLSK